MAEGDRAAVDVDPALIPLQYPANRDRLSGKGLIGFDQIDVVQPPAFEVVSILRQQTLELTL